MGDRLKYFLGFVIACLSILIVWYFRAVVSFLLVSAVISLVARPIFDLIKRIRIRKWQASNSMGALLTILTLWIFVVSFFRVSVPFIIEEVHFLSNVDLDAVFDAAERLLGSIIEPLQESEFGKAGIEVIEAQLKDTAITFFDFSRLRDIVTSLAGFLGGLFIFAFSVSFITFFFLKEEWLIIQGLLLFIPNQHEDGIKHVLASIKTLLRRYFIGIIIQITLITVIVTLGLAMVGVGFQHAVIIGLFSGLINVIPYMGPLIGAFFGFLVSLVVYVQMTAPPDFLHYMFGVFLVFVIVQLLDNIVFQPFIFSASVRAHPLEIFILILMAGYMSGIIGMFLAIPVYTIIRVIAKEFFFNYKLVQKLTEKIKE
ncbi:AI-2E family transporter [Carboxylicivirga sp. M1479]|uniref:AI-2E family transporter n=1 Tax=Carboxylicivirga sp. M1479 TaxID=2594476 RepID=UPI00117751C0|nr:AI-2E family transporter [Carboxylicivirga sp. M1479]TRX71067.1 AI-2E family transporter [Carboxylicivirga sp. M1479]